MRKTQTARRWSMAGNPVSMIAALFVLVTISQITTAADRIELDNTAIVGTRELPKVLYIVPWKDARLGTLAGVSEKGSFDSGLVALDRDVFQKQTEYYDILYSDVNEQGR